MSSGGRGRDARSGPGGGCDPPRPARSPTTGSPPADSDPCPSPRPAAPRLGVSVYATSAGRWGEGGTPGIALRGSDSPGLSEVSPNAGQLGSGMGPRSSPLCSYWNQRGQAPSGRVSGGGVPGKSRLLFGADQNGSFGPKFCFVSWPQHQLAPAVRLERVLPTS